MKFSHSILLLSSSLSATAQSFTETTIQGSYDGASDVFAIDGDS